MASVVITVDLTKAFAKLDTAQREQIPFATALALTRTAQDVQREEVREMARVFDRPTPYTLNSTFITPAKKNMPMATVGFKNWGFKGSIPATKYLFPEIFGGNRNIKRFERALQYRGLMPANTYVVPSSTVRRDAYGNIPASLIRDILSALQAFTEVGYMANRTQKSIARRKKKGTLKEYFAVPVRHGGLRPGIYQRSGREVKAIMVFASSVGYTARFQFFDVAIRTVHERFPDEFAGAMRYALKGGSTLSQPDTINGS